MDLRSYITEAEVASAQPVTGDTVVINLNQVAKIVTKVVEHSDGRISLNLSEKDLKLLENAGINAVEFIQEATITEKPFQGNDVYTAKWKHPEKGEQSFKLHADNDDKANDKAKRLMVGARSGHSITSVTKDKQVNESDFHKMPDDKLKAWLDRNDNDEPGKGGAYADQIKRARKEMLKRKSKKTNEGINDLRKLAGMKPLTEGYEDRVNAVADKIMRSGEVNNIDDLINSQVHYEPEGRLGGKAKADFIKDVKQVLSTKGFNRRAGAAKRSAANLTKKAELEEKLSKLANAIMDAAGNSFPDGDPFDALIPYGKRLGIPEYELIDWLDKAAKTHLGVPNYYAYLRNLYRDNAADHGLDPHNNPWGANESLGEENLDEAKIHDQIIKITQELEAKKKKKAEQKPGVGFDMHIDDHINKLKRQLQSLRKRAVHESKIINLYGTNKKLDLSKVFSSYTNHLSESKGNTWTLNITTKTSVVDIITRK